MGSCMSDSSLTIVVALTVASSAVVNKGTSLKMLLLSLLVILCDQEVGGELGRCMNMNW